MKFVNTKTGLIFTSNNEMVIAQMRKNPELKVMDEVTKEEAKQEPKEETKETPKKKKK